MSQDMTSSSPDGARSANEEPAGTSFWSALPDVFPGAFPSSAPSGDVVPLMDPDRAQAGPTTPRSELASKADQIVIQSFNWLSAAVIIHLNQLEADLAHQDGPSLSEGLFLGVLRVALASISGGASEHLSSLMAKGALKEVYKSAIRTSVNEGLAAGANQLRSENKREALGSFVRSHQAAIVELYEAAQRAWILTGSEGLRTDEQARAIIDGLSKEGVKNATAQLHYNSVRDAWLSYLAQTRYGTIDSIAINEDGDTVKTGQSTDMTSSARRAFVNFRGIGRPPGNTYEQTDGPEWADSFLGVGDGVLTVIAELPSIHRVLGTELHAVLGSATVTDAYLNGVSDRVREQFVGKPLSSAKVPRLIICKVSDGYDDFQFRVNEQGIPFGARSPWLAARAVTQPGNLGKDPDALREIGISLLLNELVPSTFQRGTSE